MNFRVDSSFQEAHPNALAFYCSDGRFTRAVEELLVNLGHDRLDTLTMPGAAGLLNANAARLADGSAARRALSFLITGHAIESLVLVAHEGCGYYKARHKGASSQELIALQLEDLKSAAVWLKETHPGVKLSMHFARIDEEHVIFVPISDRPRTPT